MIIISSTGDWSLWEIHANTNVYASLHSGLPRFSSDHQVLDFYCVGFYLNKMMELVDWLPFGLELHNVIKGDVVPLSIQTLGLT